MLLGLKSAGLKFDTVSPTEWVNRLAKSNPDGLKNPTIKLLVSQVLFVFARPY
jgi:hypothetical protein